MGDHAVASLGNITSATDNQCLFDGLLCARHFLSLNFHKHESQINCYSHFFPMGESELLMLTLLESRKPEVEPVQLDSCALVHTHYAILLIRNPLTSRDHVGCCVPVNSPGWSDHINHHDAWNMVGTQ